MQLQDHFTGYTGDVFICDAVTDAATRTLPGHKVTASWLINAAVTNAATRSLHWINR